MCILVIYIEPRKGYDNIILYINCTSRVPVGKITFVCNQVNTIKNKVYTVHSAV